MGQKDFSFIRAPGWNLCQSFAAMIDRATAFRSYLGMRLTKQTVKQLAFRARKPKSTLHDWYTGKLFPGLDDITPLSRNLNCPELVILGF